MVNATQPCGLLTNALPCVCMVTTSKVIRLDLIRELEVLYL